MLKIENKEEILKAARVKYKDTYKGKPIKTTESFSTETLKTRRVEKDVFQAQKKNTANAGYCIQQNYYS
jgi:hypothetical protein